MLDMLHVNLSAFCRNTLRTNFYFRLERSKRYLYVMRPQFSIAPALKSGSAIMSCLGSGYGMLKKSSNHVWMAGPILREYCDCCIASGRAQTEGAMMLCKKTFFTNVVLAGVYVTLHPKTFAVRQLPRHHDLVCFAPLRLSRHALFV